MKTKILFFCFTLFLGHVNAQDFAVTIGENVNIRSGVSLNAAKIGKVEKDLSLVEVLYIPLEKDKIKISGVEMEDYWVQIKTKDGMDGFVFGYFLKLFDSKADAEYFIAKNKEFRANIAGMYNFFPQSGEFTGYHDYAVEMFNNGRLKMSASKTEGDHSLQGDGDGRYFIDTVKGTILFQAIIKYEFAPDGYTWSEYFQLARGHKPTKAELDNYIKEMSVFYELEKYEEKIDQQNEVLKPVSK